MKGFRNTARVKGRVEIFFCNTESRRKHLEKKILPDLDTETVRQYLQGKGIPVLCLDEPY